MNARIKTTGSRCNPSKTSVSENQWIENTFQKRQCIKFIPNDKSPLRCSCGRPRLQHPVMSEGVVRVSYPAEKWSTSHHTEASPTDAYGTIEFQGGPHPTKAQYVRLSYDTKPEKIMLLLQEHWGLDLPKLLISVQGGIANFDLQPKLRRVCRQGLLRAAKTTGAWIMTGGTNTGVMKHVGDALGDTLIQSRNNIVTIGIAPWGVVHKREDLLGKDTVTPYHAIALPSSDSIVLNSNHSYFLLVDDGSVGKFGCETVLRKKLEKYISQQRISTRGSGRDYCTPVVCLFMEGGSNSIRTVLECVTDHPPIPVVVIDGSGRASDLLSFTHKFAQPDGTMPDSLKDQLLATIARTFHYSVSLSERLYTELMLCTKKRQLITVFRIGDDMNDIDQAILTALLKGQNTSSSDQLSLALTWNRVDIARSHIFAFGHMWPEGALDPAMMEALVNDRVDFVKLLIENGVNMQKWLTIERLEELYNLGLINYRLQPAKAMFASTRPKLDSSSTLKHLLTEHRRNIVPGCRFTLYDIGQAINKLMGGAYQSTYCRRKFRTQYNSVMKRSRNMSNSAGSIPVVSDHSLAVNNRFKYPYSDLMIWAVLLRRQKMAKFMWEHGEEALAKALVACKLYKSMAREAEEDELEVDVANEIRQYSKEFANLSTELLDHCYKTNDDLTQLLLTYELSTWSDQTCLSLAVSASHRQFIAHTCCQILLTEMWMGGLRTRKYASLKVVGGIFFFPSILFFDYRSREELELMPVTMDEHIQDHRDSDSDDSESDDSSSVSVASHKSVQYESKPNDSFQNPEQKPLNSSVGSLNKYLSKSKVSLASNGLQGFSDLNKKSSPLRLGKKIFEFYTAPITKFWLHAIGYTVFLTIFIYIVLIRSPKTPSALEWYVVAYMIGLTLEKIREFVISEPTKMRQKLRVFFTDFWNVFDMLTIALFFVGLTLRLQNGLVGDGQAFYCLTVALCIIRILDFFVISQHLGPFVHIIGKMVRELLYFVVFLLIILVAFGTFRQGLWFPDEDFKWDLVREIFLKPYFMLYGEVYADEVWPDCTDNVTSEEVFQCVPGRWLVPAGQSLFLIIGIILLLSLLIAVFNNIFLRTYILSNQVWKFQRYVLVIEYEARPILPSPLIILNHVFLIVKYLRRKCHNKRKIFDTGLKLFLPGEDIERLHDFEEECMEIYYREKENSMTSSTDQMMRQNTDTLENVCLRMDDIHLKENTIRQCLQMMDSHLLRLEEVSLRTASALYEMQQHIMGSTSLPRNQSPRLRSDHAINETYREFNYGAAGPVKFGDRVRHNSCSASLSVNEVSSAVSGSNIERRSDHHVRFVLDDKESKNVDQVDSLPSPNPLLGASDKAGIARPNFLEVARPKEALSKKMLLTISPLTPIVTPNRIEYTSITDDIDTSCVNNHSPPDTPPAVRWSSHKDAVPDKRRKNGKKRRRADSPTLDRFKKAEETVHQQMEVIVNRRIRQISLTETAEGYGNLAKHAVQSMDDSSQEELNVCNHHSDDESGNKALKENERIAKKLKSIKSEPMLKKSISQDSDEDVGLEMVELDIKATKSSRAGQNDRYNDSDILSFSVASVERINPEASAESTSSC